MSFVIYIAMLVAALVSVVMGLDLAGAPPAKIASRPALVEPIRHEATPVQPAVQSPPPVAQQAAPKPPAVQSPAMPPANTAQQPMPQIYQPEQTTAQNPEAAPACNVAACTTAYRSFTAADCTYQPTDGPRRLCTKK